MSTATVDEFDALLAGLRPHTEVVILSASADATTQIYGLLRDRNDVETVPIVAHGHPGEISFSAGSLSLENISEFSKGLRRVGQAIADGGHIALWVCEAGKGDRGSDFVRALAQASGVNVVAASGLVGSPALGGKWTLDVNTTQETIAAPLTARAIETYASVMANKTWTGVGGATLSPRSGNWSASTNWSPVGVPQAGDDVRIGVTSGLANLLTVTLDVNTAALNSLTIKDIYGTLAVAGFGLNVAGTSASAINLQAGNLTINGGAINDAGRFALAWGTSVTGAGTLKISGQYSGAGALKANGGTLDLFGTINSGIALQIATGSVSTLKIEGTATAANGIAIYSNLQTLEIGAAGNLTINGTESISSGKIQLDGGTLTDPSGVTVGTGALLTGKGTVSAPVSGRGTIKASGGALDLTGTVSSGPSLTIDTTAGSVLKIDGKATAASAIGISNANQTLEIGAAGNLTINKAENISNGKIQLDGGTLTDGSGLVDGTGAHLAGFGVVSAGTTATTDIDGTGAVTASGGVLEFKTLVDGAAASAFDIANVTGSVLKFDAAVGTTSVHPTITFDGTNGGVGTLDLRSTTLANFHGIIANFSDGEQIKVANATSVSLDSTGTLLTVFNGSTTLGTLKLSTTYAGDTFTVTGGTITVVGPPSAAQSSITANPTKVTADGTSTTTLTVTVEDALGHAVAGKAVTLSASGGAATRLGRSRGPPMRTGYSPPRWRRRWRRPRRSQRAKGAFTKRRT